MKTLTRKTIAWTFAAFAAAGAARAQSLLHEGYGKGFDDQLGHAVAGGADIDRDGWDDVVVGAPFADAAGLVDNGSIQVISGRTGKVLFKKSGDESDDHFGWSVAIAGDVDGDGWPDFIAGAPNGWDGSGRTGMARVFSGKSGNALYTVYGDDPADEFGFAVAGELDWDGDAYADFAVGAPNGATVAGSAIAPGHVRVFAGASGTSLQKATSIFSYARWGESLCRGDLDGDGIHDLVVGAPLGGVNDNGQAKVISGATHFALEEWFGDSFGDRFGAAVSSGQDLDGDGFDEVLVGAPEDDDGGGNAGSLRLFDGQSGAALHTWYGADDQEGLGTSVAFSDDLDGDGDADVIAGAIEAWVGGTGSVLAFGSSSHAELLRLQGDLGSRFGKAVASAGDFNRDGIPDVAAGGYLAVDPENPLAPVAGLLRVHSLAAPGFVNYCKPGTSASGCLALISGKGMPSATAPSGFFLQAAGGEGKNDGMFFFGWSGRQASPWGNGTSLQCVVPPTKRAGLLQGFGANGSCDALFSMDLNARWCPTCPKAPHNPGGRRPRAGAALVPRSGQHLEPDDLALERARVRDRPVGVIRSQRRIRSQDQSPQIPRNRDPA